MMEQSYSEMAYDEMNKTAFSILECIKAYPTESVLMPKSKARINPEWPLETER